MHKQSLQIKEDGKFFTRFLSKETSTANSSCRVLYYGDVSGAVPFMWESQPGTPKHTFSEASLPPLTPPPSYYSNSKSNSMKKMSSSKPNILYTIFPKLPAPRKKAIVSPSSSLSSVSSSSLSSSWSSSTTYSSSPPSSMKPIYHGRRYSSLSSSSTSSFGGSRLKASNRFRGCYPMGNMKNAFFCIVGHGSSQGTA